jgi:adenylyl-sulfate kinase
MTRQRAVTLWFTGLSGSGKTTTAEALQQKLSSENRLVYVLDGDVLRTGLSQGLSYSIEDRSENVRRAAEVAKILNSIGAMVIVTLISPLKVDRENAREIIGSDKFFEIYISTPISVCESRDVKGLYARARKGEIPEFTGITSPYEMPDNPSLKVDTTDCSIDESLTKILHLLREI